MKKAQRVAVIILVMVILFFAFSMMETYTPAQSAYRYDLVDTNPKRRVSGFFDGCSPENMEDCTRNNPYDGLPLP
jgi:hypothetical protein